MTSSYEVNQMLMAAFKDEANIGVAQKLEEIDREIIEQMLEQIRELSGRPDLKHRLILNRERAFDLIGRGLLKADEVQFAERMPERPPKIKGMVQVIPKRGQTKKRKGRRK